MELADHTTYGYGGSHQGNVTTLASGKDNEAIRMMWLIGAPIIFIVGMCGNALVLVVMTRRQMVGTSTSVHLCIMAVADMFVLAIGLVPEWVEISFDKKFKEIHQVTCKLEKFIFYTSGDTSIWVLVIFTLDRLVAIGFPLRKKSICVPSRAKIFGLLAFLVAIIKNLHVFWTRGTEFKTRNNITSIKSNCGKPTPSFEYFENFIRPWIVFATVNFIPFVVILCCNIVIIRALFAVRRVSTIGALVSPSVSDRSMIQMTTMCLSASFCFLICITPSLILVIGRPYWDKTKGYDLAKGISNVLVYVNHSVNFFLYCMTGRRFRRLLVWSIFRRCYRFGNGWAPGDSTIMETHATFARRSSAFMNTRKTSQGNFMFNYRMTDYRRPSKDDTGRRCSALSGSASQESNPDSKTNHQETDM